MKIAGSIAMVTGAHSAVGAAILRELVLRRVGKVYADAPWDPAADLPSAAPAWYIDLQGRADSAALARELTDVNLLIHCVMADRGGVSAPGGAAGPGSGQPTPSVDHILALTDELAPVLSDNGGGAVVNVVCELHSDQLLDPVPSKPSRPSPEFLLADRLRGRLAAQRTQLLFFCAQLVVGSGDRALEDQQALTGHIAMRLLNQLDAEARHG